MAGYGNGARPPARDLPHWRLAARREPSLARALQSTEAGGHAWLVMAAVEGFDPQFGVERELPEIVFEQLELLLLHDPRSSR